MQIILDLCMAAARISLIRKGDMTKHHCSTLLKSEALVEVEGSYSAMTVSSDKLGFKMI